MRLFIAIPLPAAVVTELSEISNRLRSDQDGLRWASPESWHITLQFLGNTSPEQYSCLIAGLRNVRSGSVPISFKDLGIFDRAGIFFADVAVSHELLRLQRSVIEATSQCGFIAEDRPYHPHVTLARAKGDGRSQSIRALKSKMNLRPHLDSFAAEKFRLYEAFLGSSGSRYEVRGEFKLGGQ
jgi:2'-5' RNA ligase